MRKGHRDARIVAKPLTSKETRAWPLASSTIRAPGSFSLSTDGAPAPSATKPSRQRCPHGRNTLRNRNRFVTALPHVGRETHRPRKHFAFGAPSSSSSSSSSSPNQCRRRCFEPMELRQRNPTSRAMPNAYEKPGFSSVTIGVDSVYPFTKVSDSVGCSRWRWLR